MQPLVPSPDAAHRLGGVGTERQVFDLLLSGAEMVRGVAHTEAAAHGHGNRPAGGGMAHRVLAPAYAAPAALSKQLDRPTDVVRADGGVCVDAHEPSAPC